MKQLYFLFLIFLFPALMTAQEIDEDMMLNKASNGYIVLDNQDTTWGKVKVSTRTGNQIKVNFLADSTSRWKTYKAKDEKVSAYGYKTIAYATTSQRIMRWQHFKRRTADQPPTPSSSTTVFMECKVAGEVNLYSYYVLSNLKTEASYNHYYIIEQKFAIDVEEYRTRKITRDNFEAIIPSLAEGCTKIKKLSYHLDYSNFDKVIELYNECQMENIGCGEGNITERRREREAAARKLREARIKKEEAEDEKFKTTRRKKN